MCVYGDLDLSIIREMPKGRKPVRTKVFREKQRAKMYAMIHEEIKKGRQAYFVYPLVEESEIVRRETDLFVKRVYEGSVNMLIKGYIDSGELTQDEIDALRKMLEKTEQE